MLYHCFASFKQSLLDFFKLVDSRLILMLLYDSLHLIINVKLRGLDYVAYKMPSALSY